MDRLVLFFDAATGHCANSFKIQIFEGITVCHARKRVVNFVFLFFVERIVNHKQECWRQSGIKLLCHVYRHGRGAGYQVGCGFRSSLFTSLRNQYYCDKHCKAAAKHSKKQKAFAHTGPYDLALVSQKN